MKPIDERAKEAEERLAPILQELHLILIAKARIDDDGKISAVVQWADTYKPEELPPDVNPDLKPEEPAVKVEVTHE